jgi:hypothetical protein
MYTEENAKLNWINRTLGDFPQSFEELEQQKDGHLLECFKCLSKDAIDYETRALHFSAHMFLKNRKSKSNYIRWSETLLTKTSWKAQRLINFTLCYQRSSTILWLLKKKPVKRV